MRLLSPEVLTHSPGRVEVSGIDAQIAAWRDAHEGIRNLQHDIRVVVAFGLMAVARIRVSGRHRGPFLGIAPTGAELDVDLALFVRVDAGRIAEMWEVVDTGLALRQLGVLGKQSLSPGAAE